MVPVEVFRYFLQYLKHGSLFNCARSKYVQLPDMQLFNKSWNNSFHHLICPVLDQMPNKFTAALFSAILLIIEILSKWSACLWHFILIKCLMSVSHLISSCQKAFASLTMLLGSGRHFI